MGSTVAIGSDGKVELPSGYVGTLNTWSCSITRATTPVTGFSQVGTTRVASSIFDITGSAGGFPNYDTGSTDPLSQFVGASGPNGGSVHLFWNSVDGNAAECSLEFDAVFSSIAIGSSQDGEATLAFNFELADANAPVFTWYEV